MKYVKPLTPAERVTLQEAWKYGPTARVRQRAHAVYLSAQGFCIPQLVPIFEVDRDTVSGWIEAWERDRVVGLFDAHREWADTDLQPAGVSTATRAGG
ncbi:MAG: helix-turn-helix domain-containing protein [Candidatus Competibacteraceae bacterium]